MIFMDYLYAEKQIEKLIVETDISQILDKVVNYLYKKFEKYSWIGFYIISGYDLILGPWRGKQATEHIRIPIGKGICGSAAKSGKIEIISNVNKDNRYLSCFVSTKSEIVIPIKKNDVVIGEMDIDSDMIDAFDKKDVILLKKICSNNKLIKAIANYRQ